MDIKNCSRATQLLYEREELSKALQVLEKDKVQRMTVTIEYLQDIGIDRCTPSQVEYRLSKKYKDVIKSDLKASISKIEEELKKL